MIKHISKYELKKYIRNRSTILWLFLFSIAFLTFFYFALGNLFEDDLFEMPETKVLVMEEENSENFIQFLEEMDGVEGSIESESLEPLRELGEDEYLIYMLTDDYEEAKALLLDNQVNAIIFPAEEVRFEASMTRGIEPTIIKEILKAFEQYQNIYQSIENGLMEGDIPIENIKDDFQGNLEEYDFPRLDTSQRQEAVSMTLVYLFSLLAYLSFYPVSAGIDAVESVEANQSKQAMRKTISPVSKRKNFLGTILPYIVVHIIFVIFTYLYARLLGMNVADGYHLSAIFIMILGSLAAIFSGTFIGGLFPQQPGLRTALSIGVPLFFAAVSGLMSDVFHAEVMKNAPWIHDLNPLGRVSNALYALNLEGVGPRYQEEVIGLAIYIFVFFVLSLVVLRGDDYESL